MGASNEPNIHLTAYLMVGMLGFPHPSRHLGQDYEGGNVDAARSPPVAPSRSQLLSEVACHPDGPARCQVCFHKGSWDTVLSQLGAGIKS